MQAIANPAQAVRAPDPIRKTAVAFEAGFLAIMLDKQFETLGADSPLGGAASQAWLGLLSEQIGTAIARSGGVGVADHVAREIIRLQAAQGSAT